MEKTDQRFSLLMTASQMEAIFDSATEQNMFMAQWIREACDRRLQAEQAARLDAAQ